MTFLDGENARMDRVMGEDMVMHTALIVAMAVRNAMEDFHCEHLSDAQMKELNPIIRNAIYTALKANESVRDGLLGYGPEATKREMRLFKFLRGMVPDYWEDPEIIRI